MVLRAGIAVSLALRNTSCILRAPHVGCAVRTMSTFSSTRAGVRFGVWNGALLRFPSPCPERQRFSHLSPVARVMLYFRHSALLLSSPCSASCTNSQRNFSTVFSFYGIKPPPAFYAFILSENCILCLRPFCILSFPSVHFVAPHEERKRKNSVSIET